MKQYKKGLLCIMVLSAMSLMAAEDKTIYVNTFDDESGENPEKCSLREAVIAASKNAAFGGCSAGRTGVGQTDVIQLEEGTYTLTKGELAPASIMKILGKSRMNYQVKSALTDEYPQFEDIKTVIEVKDGSSRIFNTAENSVDLLLEDIALKNGKTADYGGAVYAGGNFSLTRGAILNSSAAKAGGAIYLVALDSQKKISISSSRIENNQSPKGSVMAMSCLGNLKDGKPQISVAQSSIVNNGSADSQSVIDLCGSNTVDFDANTIAKNTANAATGSVIRAVSEGLDRLSPYSDLTFSSNTIVENNAFSTLYYDSNATKYFYYNIIAFNGTADGKGKSCRYINNATPPATLQFTAMNNALELSNENCMLPENALTTSANYKNIDVSGMSMASLLTGYMPASLYNKFLPLYYLRAGTDLIDTGSLICSDYDQRGMSRSLDASVILNIAAENTCDIGSVELLRFNAADVENLTNVSQKVMLDQQQASIDQLKADIEDPARKEYKIANQADLKVAEEFLAKLKGNLIYRALYIEPFNLALPEEVMVGNTEERRYKALNADNYDVSVKALGIGTELTVDSAGNPVLQGQPLDLVCKWDPDLKRILIYREGGGDSLGQYAYCQYTLKEKTGSMLESSGVLKAEIKNIAPIAVSDSYVISPDSNLTVTVNPLENDSDDGDGPLSKLPAGKKLWHQNVEGKNIPIYFSSMPAGLNFKAEYSGPCPVGYEQNTCYGGQIEFSAKNAFSQNSYQVNYKVYDSEGAESNTASINLNNSVKNTNASASGGGGSSSAFSFAVLALLALYRMRKYMKRHG